MLQHQIDTGIGKYRRLYRKLYLVHETERQWNFDLSVVFETWIAAEGCSLAEKQLTSGDV